MPMTSPRNANKHYIARSVIKYRLVEFQGAVPSWRSCTSLVIAAKSLLVLHSPTDILPVGHCVAQVDEKLGKTALGRRVIPKN